MADGLHLETGLDLSRSLPSYRCSLVTNNLTYAIIDSRGELRMISEAAIRTYRQAYQKRLAQQQRQREAARQQVLQEVMERIPAVAAAYPSVKRLYLFGSLATPGTFRPDSDVDIAVEGGGAETYFALWRDLDHAFPDWFIDLRDISTPSSFAEQVRRRGVVIYERRT
jgi:predicted nucleotidyltransferase